MSCGFFFSLVAAVAAVRAQSGGGIGDMIAHTFEAFDQFVRARGALMPRAVGSTERASADSCAQPLTVDGATAAGFQAAGACAPGIGTPYLAGGTAPTDYHPLVVYYTA